MTKYQTLQELFVSQGHQLYADANVCFDFVEYLTREFLTYSGWYADDLEFISLSEPIRAERPDRRMRFNWMGSNRERIRDVTCMLEDGYWYLGLRLRLRPHVSVPFRHQDAWFVIPLILKRQSHSDESCVVKLHRDGRSYNAEQLEPLFDLLLGRIETILKRGVQPWLDSPILGDGYKLFGFVLDRDWGKALPADENTAESESVPLAIAAAPTASQSEGTLASDSGNTAVALLNGRVNAPESLNGVYSDLTNGTAPKPSPEATATEAVNDEAEEAIAEIPPEAQTQIEPPDTDPPDEPPPPRSKSTRKRKT